MNGRRYVLLFATLLVLFVPPALHAQTTSTDPIDALQAKIAQYQQQLTALSTQKTTLKSTISALTLSQQKLTAQIQLTQTKIANANGQIQSLTHSIGNTEDTIAANQEAVAKGLRSAAQSEETPLVARVLSTDTLAAGWQVADQVVQFNAALDADITDLRIARATLAANRDDVAKAKADLVSLQNDLSTQKRSVTASKAQQQDLLAQTNNDEAKFQKLLATAKAELVAFSAFTANAGGAKLLDNQTVCDSWGCYYSQRDRLWGNMPLNGTQFRLASDGCLVTAMAMVLTHYGYHDVTPVTINSDPQNFATYYPAYLLYTIHVDGATATRKTSTIDATLATGNPVVVGIHAYGGTHFVVLVSGNRGNYLMRDPYVANGKDISFTSHYTIGSIFGISKVIITS